MNRDSRLEYFGLDHELLTAEEELELAKRLPDKRARDRLVQCNMRLVLSIAKRHTRPGSLTLADLVAEGAIGLMKAIDKFEWQRGHKLSTYASWWICQNIRRALDDCSAEIRIPVHLADRRRTLSRHRARFLAAAGREPTPDELRKMAPEQTHQREIAEALLRPPRVVMSVDAPLGEDEGGSMHDVLPGADEPPLVALLAAEREAEARAMLESLTDRPREVLLRRFGAEGETLQAIASSVGLTRERIRQIEVGALAELRARSRRRRRDVRAEGP